MDIDVLRVSGKNQWKRLDELTRARVLSGEDIDDLIAKVCSKGGTTIAGIEGFQAKGLDAAVAYGIQRCIERAHELGQANG